MPGYPTNKQQLRAALRSHLQFETETLCEVSDRNYRSVFRVEHRANRGHDRAVGSQAGSAAGPGSGAPSSGMARLAEVTTLYLCGTQEEPPPV